MGLEPQLRRALRRVEPERDLVGDVLARLDEAPLVPPRAAARRFAPWALAASVLLALGTGFAVQQNLTRTRNEVAGRELAYALQLTSQELQNVRQHLERRTEEKGS